MDKVFTIPIPEGTSEEVANELQARERLLNDVLLTNGEAVMRYLEAAGSKRTYLYKGQEVA